MDTDKEAMQTEAEIRLTPSMRSSEKKANRSTVLKYSPRTQIILQAYPYPVSRHHYPGMGRMYSCAQERGKACIKNRVLKVSKGVD